MCTGACDAGDLVHHLAQVLHWHRFADEPGLLAPAPIDLQGVLDDVPQVVEVQRLGDEIEGPELQRLHGGLDVAVGRDHRYRHVGHIGLDPVDELQSVSVRQAHVRQAQVEAAIAEQRLGTPDVARGLGCDVHAPERQRQELANVGFVVDNQCQGLLHSGS